MIVCFTDKMEFLFCFVKVAVSLFARFFVSFSLLSMVYSPSTIWTQGEGGLSKVPGEIRVEGVYLKPTP